VGDKFVIFRKGYGVIGPIGGTVWAVVFVQVLIDGAYGSEDIAGMAALIYLT
jgi:hypothetical protein